MGVSGTPCGRGRCLDPSPYPLPWTWRGGFAGRWSAQDGPRWLQEGLRALKMASKIAQDSPTWLQLAHNMRPRGSSTAPRRLQVVKEHSKEALEKPKSFKNIGKPMCFAFSPFRFRWALEASRWLQDGPRRPHERPKTAPRRPQERPRAPQEGPKKRFCGPRKGGLTKITPPFFDRWPPRWPKRRPGGPKRPPRDPQETSQETPRGIQEASSPSACPPLLVRLPLLLLLPPPLPHLLLRFLLHPPILGHSGFPRPSFLCMLPHFPAQSNSSGHRC